MLSKIKKKLFDLKVALYFYLFLYKRGVLREFIKACKDNNQGYYEGVLHRLSRGVTYEYLIMQSFSFARQMYVLHSNTDWWGISHDWSHSELFKSKKVSKYDLGRAFETLLFLTGLHHNYMKEFDRQYGDLMDFESFLLRTPIEHWVMAVKCPIKDFGWWQELDIRWQIYHKGIIK